MLFENFKPWNNDVASFHRGAWVRIYGIPVHAWNESFFKLCVMDCGRYLRTDGMSMDKDRLDFARVLVSTPSLEIINVIDNILVDDIMVEIKIVEEWGFNLGEDVCLSEEENVSVISHSDHEQVVGGEDVDDAVDLIVKNLSDEGRKADGCGVHEEDVSNDRNSPILTPVVLKEQSKDDGGNTLETETVVIAQPSQAAEGEIKRPTNVRTSSCPPGKGRMTSSGPWSIEWLNDHFDEDAGIVFSSKKKKCMSKKVQSDVGQGSVTRKKNRNSGGVLHNSALSLKKIARLPSKDRNAVLKIMRKQVRKRSGRSASRGSVAVETHPTSSHDSSSASVNNDWQHYVVMHGNQKVAVEDVWGVGKAIGVKFNGDPNNMFNVLSRVGRGKKAVGEGVKGDGSGGAV
jgi:hypothetical protein